jgi:hypothetical protein
MARPDIVQRFISWLESVSISETDANYAILKVRELPTEQMRGFPYWFILKMVHPSFNGPVVKSKEKMSI